MEYGIKSLYTQLIYFLVRALISDQLSVMIVIEYQFMLNVRHFTIIFIFSYLVMFKTIEFFS